MNFGFNSNVRIGDAMYHVQTEDRGPSHPFLDTVVYMAGRVIYKRSTSYQAKPADPGKRPKPRGPLTLVMLPMPAPGRSLS